MKTFWKIVIVATFVYFFSWLIVYKLGINQLPIQSEDTIPALFLPVAIIKDQTLHLDKYYAQMIASYPHPDDKDYKLGLVPFYLREVNGHYVSAFPMIAGFLATPIYLIPVLLGITINFVSLGYLAHLSSAVIMAFSGGFLYLLLKKHFPCSRKQSQLLTFVYLFGTLNFAILSQGLWQHGIVQLFIILALLFLYDKRYFLSSLMLGLMVLTRFTSPIILGFLGLLVIGKIFGEGINKKKLKDLASFILGFIPSVLFFFWYNKTLYLDLSNQGYSNHILTSWLSPFPEGFLGMWLSPSKGILTYSPILIFGLIGAYLALRNGLWKKDLKNMVFLGAVLSHTLVLSIWKHWYGGWSFGYRMGSDIIIFLILLMVPFVTSVYFEKFRKWFIFLFVFSVLVQLFGIIFYDGIWHAAYDDGFVDTKWLWSIKDSEFAFNIRRVLVKLRVLERACPKCAVGP